MLRSVSIALRCLHNLKVFHGIELSTGNVLLPCLIFCLFCAAKKRVNQRPFGGVVTRQIAVMLADFNFIEQNLCSVLIPNQTLRCPEKNNTAIPAWMTVSALLLHMSRKPGARLSPAPPPPPSPTRPIKGRGPTSPNVMH